MRHISTIKEKEFQELGRLILPTDFRVHPESGRIINFGDEQAIGIRYDPVDYEIKIIWGDGPLRIFEGYMKPLNFEKKQLVFNKLKEMGFNTMNAAE